MPSPKSMDSLTPMMEQYFALKAAHKQCLLFYRMGDFYELFFEDAYLAARTLSITLTQRGEHKGKPIPMCGVPAHSAESYLARLVQKGFKVAVCEQMETPQQARQKAKGTPGGKVLVRRDVVRVLTPGTLTEDALLDARTHNYLAALCQSTQNDAPWGLAWLDISTGDLAARTTRKDRLASDIATLNPREVLLTQSLIQEPFIKEACANVSAVEPMPETAFSFSAAEHKIKSVFSLATLEGLGAFSKAEISAIGALLDYVEITQIDKRPVLKAPRHIHQGQGMMIDVATRRNLELSQTLSGQKKGSFFSVIDHTLTNAGARLLDRWLAMPLIQKDAIHTRLEAVDFFVKTDMVKESLRAILKSIPDVERAFSRLMLDRGGPRDLAAIKEGLHGALNARRILYEHSRTAPDTSTLIKGLCEQIDIQIHDVVDTLNSALKDNLPLLARDGGFIADGYDPTLDEQKQRAREKTRLLKALESRYAQETKVRNLKIKSNMILGTYVEVPLSQGGDKLASEEFAKIFFHRQTLANTARFSTQELNRLAMEISQSDAHRCAREQELFGEFVDTIKARATSLRNIAKTLAKLDVLTSLAHLAQENNYCRPTVDDTTAFNITKGRHPVVEASMGGEKKWSFIANDCNIGTAQENGRGNIWLVTGPNMAGKSTFLRQNALITILAQIGSYVPAQSAHIGIVKRIFSRVGAADDLARGRSTFMVEMVEAATILNQAECCDLVIFDEIGRGTATYDGLSIAWATLEHLHNTIQCRTLFATHYHELTDLTQTLARLQTVTMLVKDSQGKIVFLYEIVAGTAKHSYGLEVARLAGVPETVTRRARQLLAGFEKTDKQKPPLSLEPPIAPLEPPPFVGEPSAVEQAIAALDPDSITAREALEQLYALKKLYLEKQSAPENE